MLEKKPYLAQSTVFVLFERLFKSNHNAPVRLRQLLDVSGGIISQAAAGRARLAADLAALGGATALNSITAPADPCAVAGGVARANGAVLGSCAVTGEDVVVEAVVRVQVLGMDRTATAAARAGPVDAPGPGP